MTPTEQDKELRDLLEQNGWKFYEELNGFRKESKFTIPMFSTDQSKNYDTLSAGNYYELAQLITADRERVALEARIDEVGKLKLPKMRFDEYGYSPDENAVGFNSAIQLVHNNKLYRIAELKAQQEGVK